MSTLIAIAYPDMETAEKVRSELIAATRSHELQLEDAIVIERRRDGSVTLHQAMHPGRSGAVKGAAWGGAIGLLFLAPLLGAAIGAAGAGLGGKLADTGVDDSLAEEIGGRLQPGCAALIALGRAEEPERVLERIGPYGGQVIQTSLAGDDERRLRAALGEPAATG